MRRLTLPRCLHVVRPQHFERIEVRPLELFEQFTSVAAGRQVAWESVVGVRWLWLMEKLNKLVSSPIPLRLAKKFMPYYNSGEETPYIKSGGSAGK